MTFRHFVFDTISGCLAILYLRDVFLRAVEEWHQRKRAEIEMERISAEAMEKLRHLQ